MFGIGAGELMVLMALALIIVGPQKLPEFGRNVGKVVGQFKAQTDELRSVISLETQAPAPTAAATAAATSHFPWNQAPQEVSSPLEHNHAGDLSGELTESNQNKGEI